MIERRPLIVGIDGGGTSTRVAIADLQGRIVAEAHGEGINPNSGNIPEKALADTLAQALKLAPRGTKAAIRGGVAGLAGAVTNGEYLTAACNRVWRSFDLGGELSIVSDVVVAFWSAFPFAPVKLGASGDGSPVTGGAVLIAGTGAVAGSVEGGELVGSVDGYGYLLGDRGGGVWLGVQGLRAALDGAAGRGPSTMLTELLLGHQDHMAVVGEAYTNAPKDLGKYAPAVGRAADAGDQVALRICNRAAHELELTLRALPSLQPGDLVVLMGSVATGGNPVGKTLRASLRNSGHTILVGTSGVAGALTLAAGKPSEK